MIQNQVFLRKPEVWTESYPPSKRQNRDMGAISKMDFIGQNRYLEAMSVESRKTVRRQTKNMLDGMSSN